MKVPYAIIRFIGVLGALWLFYYIVSGTTSIAGQTIDAQDRSEIILKVALSGFLPAAILAVLLLLPYRKMKQASSYLCVAGMLLAGLFLIGPFFRPLFLSERFVPSVIPFGVWLSLSFSIAFLIMQAVGILFLAVRLRRF